MSKLNDLKLPPIQDLFSTQEERNSVGNIIEIPLGEIDSFPAHPFYVEDNDEMEQLAASIKEHGVLTPALIRKKKDGRYELISGHRRKRACELSGLLTLKCEVVEMTDDDATVAMVDANFQRENILPSEKAFAYKMKRDALKHQGSTSHQVGEKLLTVAKIGSENGDSQNQVLRYIRLTELMPELLKMVDEEKIPLTVGVELSFLPESEQKILYDIMTENKVVPSLKQAKILKDLSQSDGLDKNVILNILVVSKGMNKAEKKEIVLRSDKVRELIPQSLSDTEYEDYIIKALRFYKEMKGNQ